MGAKAESSSAVTDRQAQIDAFLAAAGWSDASRVSVAGDASNRRYERLTNKSGKTAILMDAPPQTGEDTRPFIAIADHLRHAGLSAPEIYHANVDDGLLLIEDFGDDVFARLIRDQPDGQEALYTLACDVLLTLRGVPQPKLPICDADWLVKMTAPVFEWYAGREDDAAGFQTLLRPLAEQVAQHDTVLMLRDYHVENLMLLPDRMGVAQVGILDFQDAMCAHPAYDLVSILQDARRDVDPVIERQMMGYYLAQTTEDRETFERDYAILGVQRNLRIIGIFARLSLHMGKPHYVDFIPRVWGYVQRNLKHPALGEVAAYFSDALPEPTPDHLSRLKQR